MDKGLNTQYVDETKTAREHAMKNQMNRLSTTRHPLYVALHRLGSPENYIGRPAEPPDNGVPLAKGQSATKDMAVPKAIAPTGTTQGLFSGF